MKFKDLFEKNRKYFIAILVIMIAGISLRTYHFHDLMRFGTDQARDAALVQEYVKGTAPLPLLGPKAGGTTFKMGPIFYYFQYTSARIFGTSPDKMAYPDLILGILTIPLLFFFLKKYFSNDISMALTALFAVSFFAVQYSRFAWNPNSLPFFVMLFLYAFLQTADPEQRKKILWSVITGIALGVGVQLHTLYMLIIPTVFVIFSGYLIWRKMIKIRSIIIIICIALVLNIPQIISEVTTGSANTKSFFSGMSTKTEAKLPFPYNITYEIGWHAQSYAMFITSIGNDRRSDFWAAYDGLRDNKKCMIGARKYVPSILNLAFGTLLLIIGYNLLIRYLRKERDEKKKNFLKLITLYTAVTFIILIPLSHVLVLRYLLILQFVPFIFLGLIAKFLQERYGSKVIAKFFLILLLLCGLNIYRAITELHSFADGNGKLKFAMWGEEEAMGKFIQSHSIPGQRVRMVFEPQNANKYIRPLSYFAKGIDFPIKPNTGQPLDEKNVAYFSMILNTKREKSMQMRRFKGQKFYNITDSAAFGRLIIYKLELIEP